ncbi:phycobiliprotein lyase [Oscillatoria sp. FACHB-1406]|uniref:phycobiliprotein lyase n=1 Tax=Oscillatoria sp. FACHB-1406 TaxID=2692846 RepID=UPI0016867553|nr:phycobiliprotein lyase [Oscillatoria sp. FACHB-1406]MBD2579819.1 phycobiliprotein lyase [Oscillatoria sp. FACHB-1406]
MNALIPNVRVSPESLAIAFFQRSHGQWKSQRRYYTLQSEKVEEVESFLSVSFLEAGSPELIELAALHELEDLAFVAGAKTTWESNYTGTQRKPSKGSTVFGVKDNILYRDRGFATTKPVTATFSFINADTMTLRTEYKGSLFEEELKLIGEQYRTRQTIISRAGEQLTIGQYLEKRIG